MAAERGTDKRLGPRVLNLNIVFGWGPDPRFIHFQLPPRRDRAGKRRRGRETEVAITQDENEARFLIRLEDEVNIAHAKELKNHLLQGLASGKELRVNLERAKELDVTILQLLWAADREARSSDTGFALAGTVPEEISAAVTDAGFEKFPAPDDPNEFHRE